MKIAIVGDSFAADEVDHSWISLLSEHHQITNYSQRGISQYRLLNIVEQNLSSILDNDCVILWHTNPDRVYINDDVEFPTRDLASHPCADLVASDSLNSNNSHWRNIAKTYYKIFHNTAQQQLYHGFVVQRLRNITQSIRSVHCSGFELSGEIISFADIAQTYPGTINHFDSTGNYQVFEYLTRNIS